MRRLFKCPICEATTTTEAAVLAATCVKCACDMIFQGVDDAPVQAVPPADSPVAPENLDACKTGLAEIEAAAAVADAEEREHLRAKEYASKAKKRLEAAEAKLRGTVLAVTARLRPRPLFADPDHHSDGELVALLAAESVQVTAEAVRGWTDAQRADARAWALANHSKQPRLIPPFLWAGDPSDDEPEPKGDDDAETAPETPQDAPAEEPAARPGESALDDATRRLGEL